MTADALERAPRRRSLHFSPRLSWGAASLLVFGIVWELAFRAGLMNTTFLTPPSAALAAGWEMIASGKLWPHAWTSLTEFAWGFFFGVVVGVPLGFAMAQWRTIESALSPTVWAAYSVPRSAFIPLLLVWFGLGLASKGALVFLGVVFPMVANTYLGVRQTDPFALRSARSFAATRTEILLKVLLPSSIPYLIDGLRLSVGRGIVGVILAELFVSSSGLGYLLRLAGFGYRTDQLLFLVVFVAAFGIALSQILIWLERRVAGWRQTGPSAE